MANLFETYKQRLSVSESVFQKAHEGKSMDSNRKLVVAKVLENTNKFLKEAMDSSMGTQRSDLGFFMKFSMNLTTVGLPY
jgi:DNA phosphorothioation-dependent restriction protein DptG